MVIWEKKEHGRKREDADGGDGEGQHVAVNQGKSGCRIGGRPWSRSRGGQCGAVWGEALWEGGANWGSNTETRWTGQALLKVLTCQWWAGATYLFKKAVIVF